jgi:hypothetical protein
MIGFDIEIANVFDLAPGEDLDAHGPFDISVCAAFDSDTGRSRVWHSKDERGEPAGTLSRAMANEVLTYLRDAQRAGKDVVAWNGLSFDLRWLGHVAGNQKLAAEVARDLVDPMFHFFMVKGFPVGLDAVATGMGISMSKLMSGAEAPKEWQRGNRQRVIEYVVGDCRITVLSVQAIAAKRRIRWKTRKGTLSELPIARLLPVREAMRLPDPDQSWMDSPIPCTKFTAWLSDAPGA